MAVRDLLRMTMLYRFFTRLWNIVLLREFNFGRVRVRYSFLQKLTYSSILTYKETSWLEAVEGNMIVVVATGFVSGEHDKINCDRHQEESSFQADSTVPLLRIPLPQGFGTL